MDVIRGRMEYDLRPEAERKEVVWPRAPDVARYRYVGELVGEYNFKDMSDSKNNLLLNFAKWIAGLVDYDQQLLLHRPSGGFTDGEGRVFVVDAGRNAIVVFDPKAPEEEESDRGEGQMLVWDRVEAGVRMAAPVSVAKIWKDEIAVADTRLGAVYRLGPKGEARGKLGEGQLERPTGLAFDKDGGRLFVADTKASDIKIFAEDGTLLGTVGRPGEGTGELNSPTHLAYARDRLYVTDALNNRIQVFDAAGQYLQEVGTRGVLVGQLTRPKGVAADEQGLSYVVESYFGHLLIYDEQGRFLLGIPGSGLKGGEFFLPAGVWLDDQGQVFIADMFNGRIVVFRYLGGKTG